MVSIEDWEPMQATSSESDNENNNSILWVHNNMSPIASEPDDLVDDPDTNGNINGSESSGSDTDEEEMESNEISSDIQAPLTQDELKIFRQTMSRLPVPETNKHKTKKEPKTFKIPKKHPVFDGQPGELDSFIVEMNLLHGDYTTGVAASMNNVDFMRKLVEYFADGSDVREWFKMYVVERQRDKRTLSWALLVKNLRKDYGVFDDPEVLFEQFWSMEQGMGSIQAYIANKKRAAILSQKNLTTDLLKYGFIRGLRPDVNKHVRILQPGTVERAQQMAIAYEGSIHKPEMRTKRRNTMERKRPREHDPNRRKPLMMHAVNDARVRDNNALSELRRLRVDKCFVCGLSGHRRENCDSTQEIKEQHASVVANLKARINGASN
jgi:hypothetical protein